ncbi:hypothetical protein BDW71DRAFT_178246 [Aspergillus fruticulosus]
MRLGQVAMPGHARESKRCPSLWPFHLKQEHKAGLLSFCGWTESTSVPFVGESIALLQVLMAVRETSRGNEKGHLS